MTDLAHIPYRDGHTYVHQRDGLRLAAQHQAVWDLMSDGTWRTPSQMEEALGCSWASIGARLRDFRKDRFGGYRVERRCAGNGLFEYRIAVGQLELA